MDWRSWKCSAQQRTWNLKAIVQELFSFCISTRGLTISASVAKARLLPEVQVNDATLDASGEKAGLRPGAANSVSLSPVG